MTPPLTKPSGAANHRGTSRQDFATPWPFIEAVESRYGPIAVDLAASFENAKAPIYIDEKMNSLEGWRWHGYRDDTGSHLICFLNPPFGDIAPWAEKCAIESAKGARILFLTPASVDSNWWKNFVHGKAWVDFLSPRISFDGKNPFPKPMALCAYGICGAGYGTWRWRK